MGQTSGAVLHLAHLILVQTPWTLPSNVKMKLASQLVCVNLSTRQSVRRLQDLTIVQKSQKLCLSHVMAIPARSLMCPSRLNCPIPALLLSIT